LRIAETILIDRAAARNLLPIIRTRDRRRLQVRGDAEARVADPRVKPASEETGPPNIGSIVARRCGQH
jgi:hypothetical protein